MQLPYNTYRSYLKSRFGKPVLKIPVNAGFSCPNLDGTVNTRGCCFCDNRSFSPVALEQSTVVSQLQRSIRHASPAFEHFIAYLQPFTNTYGTVEHLQTIYEPLIDQKGVIGLAIGTRPDCLSDTICAYLAEIAQKTYLSIEIGLQSGSDITLAHNNRGHTFEDFVTAVNKLASYNIETVAHVMLGLFGDTVSTITDTAIKLSHLPVHGIKIHQLMIIKGTEYERWYAENTVTPLTLKEYAHLVGIFLSYLKPQQCIHRIMADSHPRYGLIAPLWSAEKQSSIQYIQNYLHTHHIHQGMKLLR